MNVSKYLLGTLILSGAFVASAANSSMNNENQVSQIYEVAPSAKNAEVIPCPFGWSVEPNPSVDDSLNYVDADSTLAVSVTSIHTGLDSFVTAESYARVAAEQMQCMIPTNSNLIDNGWSFECPKEGIEAIVFGDNSELVLLAISGRNPETEAKLEEFIRFLAYESKKRTD
ncbi:MAG: hypothetical protein ACI4ND_02280 [Succinivibrio sp.]